MQRHNTEALRVPVIGADNIPLMACHPEMANKLLSRGKAVPHRINGIYCIKMRHRTGAKADVPSLDLNISSGPKTTNMAVTTDGKRGMRRVFECLQIVHQPASERHKRLKSNRHKFMKNQRSLKLKMWDRRRGKPLAQGHLGLSHLHQSDIYQIDNIVAWADSLTHLYPVSRIRIKSNRLNAKLMVNPKNGNTEYERNTLRGWQVRAYIFERDWHRCAYCDNGTAQLQIDHIVPQSRNGSNGIENLVMCCSDCNQKKADLSLEDFLAGDIQRLDSIYFRTAQSVDSSKKYLNNIMPFLVSQMGSIGLPISEWDSATTSWNRKRLGLQMNHSYDAALLGNGIRSVQSLPRKVLTVYDTEDTPRRVATAR